jgi:hypothetical protein
VCLSAKHNQEAAPASACDTRRSLARQEGLATMSDQDKSIPFDLSRYTESTRRALYDAVVAHLWTPIDPDDYTPPFSPDAAQLMVVYTHGRWLLSYIDLDEPADAPPERRTVLSRILPDPDRRFGITLSEV